MKEMLKSLIGMPIQVYPSDTYSKFGTLLDVGDQGILVQTNPKKSKADNWKTNTIIFIAFSANLIFKLDGEVIK